MSNSTFADRLKELIYCYRLNKNSLSVKLGFTANTSITRLANHPERNPSFEVICNLLRAFPDISARWLLLGEGRMLEKEEISHKALHTSYYSKESGYQMCFVTDLRPSDRMRISGYEDCEVALDVFSDSMAPKIQMGDIVLCKEVKLSEPLAYGEAYLVVTHEPIIRYIKNSPTHDTIKVGAENPRFEDMVIPKKEIKCVYRVKGLIRREAL